MRDYKKIYEEWLQSPYFDEDTKSELKSIAADDAEIKERFYTELEFGTAGLRGIIGAGTNRMNIYVVRKATQGLANYIKSLNIEGACVAIAYDSRNMSDVFSKEAALTFAANGIKAYRFTSLRPTPELSFAVRELKCISGVNITASHNPSNYNGYKVYWEDGAQFTPPHDKGVLKEVLAIEDYSKVKTMPEEEARAKGLYEDISSEIDDKYIAKVKEQVLSPEAIKEQANKLGIVYTPLHGTGSIPVRRVLSELGFSKVYVVKEQELPDGNFPTVKYPNPESSAAFDLALKLAKEKDADIVLATDPDADRLGVYVKDEVSKDYIALTGNMSGSLLCEYLLSRRKELGLLPANAEVVKSIVTTNLVDAIAKEYSCTLVEVLTGFKWIGKEILENESSKKFEYMFGLEESYGCLIGTYARDKDAVSASVALCEAMAYYKSKGKSLWEVMNDIYKKYGYYRDGVNSIDLAGIEGIQRIARIMEYFRKNTPEKLSGYKVLFARDYQEDTVKNMESGSVKATGLPKSNVLYYDCEDSTWLCIRPSGTEPKLKLYYGVKAGSVEEADKRINDLSEELNNIVKDIK